MVLPFFFPPVLIRLRVRKGEEPSGEVILRLIRDPFDTPSLAEFTQTCQEIYPQRQIAASSSRDAVNFSSARTMETLSVAAVCINNPIVRPSSSTAAYTANLGLC